MNSNVIVSIILGLLLVVGSIVYFKSSKTTSVSTTAPAGTTKPVGTTAPAGTTKPVVNTTVPVVNTTVPVVNTTVPVVNTTVPVVNTTVPVVNTTKPVLSTLPNGKTVVCYQGTGFSGSDPNSRYRYVGNDTLRLYPNIDIAKSYVDWNPEASVQDCTKYTRGQDLGFGLPDGKTVVCYQGTGFSGADPNSRYRYVGNNTLRLYPNINIAQSYPDWDANAFPQNCTKYTRGEDMRLYSR
jgi:hypothetical protein